MESSAAVLKLNESQRQCIELMNDVLGYISLFVCFVLGFLILYASQFLMKRRKQEFGTYMVLGMSKWDLSKILLMETILIGLVSLVIGLIVGVFGSQFMSLLVAKMFEVDMSDFIFTFSFSSLAKTILFFAIVYAIVMVFHTFSISHCKLIDLISAAKKNESIKVKNPLISSCLCVLSILMLGYAYHKVISEGLYHMELYHMDILGYMILLGCAGTLLFFYSFSGLLLRMVQSVKGLYYRHLNMFVLRQINSKINTMVISMSVICIMLFLTICILSSGLAIRDSMMKTLREVTPVDINISQTSPQQFLGDGDRNSLEEESKQYLMLLENGIEENMEYAGIPVDQYFCDRYSYRNYVIDGITMGTLLGDNKEKTAKEYPNLYFDSPILMVRLSDYNQIAKYYHLPALTLAEDEYLLLYDYDNMTNIWNQALQNPVTLNIHGENYYCKANEVQEVFVDISASHTNTGILLVPDAAVTSADAFQTRWIANYQAEFGSEEYQKIEDALFGKQSYFASPTYELQAMSVFTKQMIYDGSVSVSAVAVFIGIYLGIIFLISSAAILALKELSDSADNKMRYATLRRIGVDEGMINKALLLQIGIFFFLPIALALVHSIFGINFCNQILETIGRMNMLFSIVMTAIFIVFIYGGYFVLTYFCSKNIVKEH